MVGRLVHTPHRPLQPHPAFSRPSAAAGMDNHIKIWLLEQHERTLAASDEWQPGPQVFPAAVVTMPTFSTEVGKNAGKGWQSTGCRQE